ncbi:UvrD-helicase domain-containing protein [Planomonospora parontospora]|uniref:UvrD-helicase domain-containing protein n=1 Tax=Planomonospora parontospora TaxID=58119 RepID=UPI00166FE21F|nr:UvrD-helicase domain-containing protein [Planomonospora parontospora]GGL15963.1 DNA helicase [Planomonospora parontospora subsp. antibiotica]GII15431.1 DNA helicase [Planomonospora parontospora subsp. antibiotica]
MARLGIHLECLKEVFRMEAPVRTRVGEVFGKFEQATYAGLHLEKVNNARDDRLRTIRVDGFWRGVVLAPESGDSYTLVKVLPHDDAYRWAERHKIEVNTANGCIDIWDPAALHEALGEIEHEAQSAPGQLFDHVSDSDLMQLGISKETLAFARELTRVEQLEKAKSFLPATQWDALFGLAAGMTPEEVWEDLGRGAEPEPFDTEDLSAAVERTSDRVLLVDGPAELMKVFRESFALWRAYLHPLQYQVAHASYRGPARITGGPGTGKTVAALHRTKHLALQNEGAVLLTTFTSALASALGRDLALLLETPEQAQRVHVHNVDQVAHRVFTERHGRPMILRKEEELEIWKRLAKKRKSSLSEQFLYDEWRQVVLAQQVTSAGDYLRAKRSGRGRSLRAQQRAQAWEIIWDFQQELQLFDRWTHETVCIEAARILAEGSEKPYRHIVVDEAQDFSPMQWRFLRAAVAENQDDLFIAGDTHQRIYHYRPSLREVGIDIGGRSARLTLNYRTTAEILGWSLSMLHGVQIDDMNEQLEKIAGCRSYVHGESPSERGFPTPFDEREALVAQIQAWVKAGVELAEIGVAARSDILIRDAKELLEREGIPASALSKKGAGNAVQIGTMHGMKGLEFRCVAVIGVGENQVPPARAVTPAVEDEAAHMHDLQRERCVLFVAATRAREQLYVSWHGQPSVFLRAVH